MCASAPKGKESCVAVATEGSAWRVPFPFPMYITYQWLKGTITSSDGDDAPHFNSWKLSATHGERCYSSCQQYTTQNLLLLQGPHTHNQPLSHDQTEQQARSGSGAGPPGRDSRNHYVVFTSPMCRTALCGHLDLDLDM